MESLSGILAFVHAARLRSYVAAGAQLGISASAVGKSVARLEDGLGVRLLNRSTRRISLTEEGELFLERCARIVRELEEAEAEVTRGRQSPRGRLRVSLPAIGYRMLVPLLPGVHPALSRDRAGPGLQRPHRRPDRRGRGRGHAQRQLRRFALEGAAVGRLSLRGGGVAGLSGGARRAQARRSGRTRAAGVPPCGRWSNCRNGDSAARRKTPPPPLRAALAFNNVEALVGAAEASLGLAYVPDFAVRQLLHDGKLVETLADWAEEGGRFSLLWPATRHALPKLRVFVDFLAERLQQG